MILLVALTGCGSVGHSGKSSDYIRYRVRTGDTLYSIAWRYGYDHREVAAWNRIAPPYDIYPGQDILIITPGREQLLKSSAKRANPDSDLNSSSQPKDPSNSQATAVTPAKPARVARAKTPPAKPAKVVWGWPAEGKVTARFKPKDGSKGIDIAGKAGQPIYAAAAGDVVYSGKGLIGYGNLIIIKHNDKYLSAYGHNKKLLVEEGQSVKKGQKIAEMGTSNKDGPILHFEVRRHGKPVNPLWYLPK